MGAEGDLIDADPTKAGPSEQAPANSPAMIMAQSALDAVGRDPRAALALADAAAAAGAAQPDPVAVATAHRAAGWALRQLNAPRDAERRLRMAVTGAVSAGVPQTAAEARTTLALVLMDQGRLPAADRQLDLAAAVLDGLPGSLVTVQRANIRYRSGNLEAARALYDQALPELQRHGDRISQARVWNNRALVKADQRDFVEAAGDMRRARALYEALGMDMLAADMDGNLALVHVRTGDLPAALAAYHRAETGLGKFGRPSGHLAAGRGAVLRLAGLTTESRTALDEGVVELTRTGQATLLAEVLLSRAETALTAGDPAAAAADAELAINAFNRQGRRAWVRQAELVGLRAADAAGAPPGPLIRSALRGAAALAAQGWPAAESDARLIAARAALRAGRMALAHRELLRASTPRRLDPIEQRIRLALARALLQDLQGRRRSGYASLRHGLRLMERHHAVLGAADLRAGAAALGAELAGTGLRWAIESGDARTVLTWSEQWRARSLQVPTVRPPRDPNLAAALDEVRRWPAGVAGTPHRAARWKAEQRAVTLDRQTGSAGAAPPPVAGYRQLADRLGAMTLVEFVELDGALSAVTLTGSRCRLHTLGPIEPVAAAIGVALFGVPRLAGRFGGAGALARIRQTVENAAATIDQALFGPLAKELTGDELLIVPTGALHSVPWGVLPTLLGRTFRLSPSAGMWSTAASLTAVDDRARLLLAQGPGLGESGEVARLSRYRPNAITLTGADATAASVLAAMDGVDVAHLAAHGRPRAENPMFSALLLADGPLTLFDLDGLRSAPGIVILPVCQSGVGAVRPGDEVIGMVSLLLSRGTTAVIAATTVVEDRVTADLMVTLHEKLAGGQSPAAALARATAVLDLADPSQFAAAAAFVCFGG